MSIKNWMKESANILFDDSKNDLRALPKTVHIKLKTNNICSLTVLGSALKSFLLSSNSIFADSFIQFFIDMIYIYNF